MTVSIFQVQPFELPLDPCTTALIVIDTQRDFVEAGGFGEVLGNDVSLVRTTIAPYKEVLAAARQKGIMVIHTCEGHREGLSDYPSVKLARDGKTFVDEPGPMGRILIRGEAGHDIIPELYLMTSEPMIGKPGKDAFYQADLHLILQKRGIKTFIVCGVTIEICVATTVREANDRGYKCVIPEDCVGSYLPESQKYALEITKTQSTIFGWVTDSKTIIAGLGG